RPGGGSRGAPVHLFSPRGLAAGAGVLYVADDGDHRIVELDPRGRLLGAFGRFGRGPGGFADAFDVALHGSALYVADDNNNRVVKLTRDLHYLGAWRGAGHARLSYLRALATDARGEVYVADTSHGRIEVFDPEGRPLRVWGVAGTAPGQFVAPLGLAADPAGDLLVVETYGSRSPIYRFTPALAYSATWRRGGGAVIGRHWFSPTSAAAAPDGSLWVTDVRNGLVRHLSPAGAFIAALGAPGGAGGGSGDGAGGSPPSGTAARTGYGGLLAAPEGVAVARSGEVYVADAARGLVARFAPDGRPLGTLGAGVLRRPVALAVDPAGVMYVADAVAGEVVKLDPRGALLGSWAVPDPAGVALDEAGSLFVTEGRADRVLKLAPDGRRLASWGAPGTGPGELGVPSGIATDCRGRVFVADTQNNRVQVFTGLAARGACAG
ncbi:MAG TPA: hypothetical protein VGX16_08125, partial [Solirubrobacteraceae bacterium]|nr:hypothetical protein [Solirubrobacteraceae bacterium]